MAIRHCPYCNSTAVVGLGALLETAQIVVELRCRNCGKIFASENRRATELPLPASEK